MAAANGNISPIFSRIADIQGGAILTTAAYDYTGNSINAQTIYVADPNNGGFVQRLRMKAIGTNIATVARVYIFPQSSYSTRATLLGAPSTVAGSASGSGGTLATQNLFCRVIGQDQYGNWTAPSTEIANVAITGPTGSVTWTWNTLAGAVAYRAYVGVVASGEECWFINTAAQTCIQTAAYVNNQFGSIAAIANDASMFYGELSLPATTLTGTSATTEIDYPLNIALPPGYRIVVGLANTVAAGWEVMGIGGKY